MNVVGVWNSGFWLLVDRVSTIALSLLTQILIVRFLGLETYGQISYLLALIALLVPVTQMGLSGIVTRSVLDKPNESSSILLASGQLRLLGAVFSVLIGALVWVYVGSKAVPSLALWVLLAGQFLVAFQVTEFFFQASQRMRELVPSRLVALSLSMLIKVAVVVSGASIELLAVAFFVDYVLVGIAYGYAYRRALPSFQTNLSSVHQWRTYFASRSKWLVFSGLAEVIYLKIDIIMLERMMGIEEVGTYSVAARLSEVWYAVPVLIMAAWFPKMWESRSSANDWNVAIQRSLDGLLALALVLAIVMQFAAGFVVTTIFGSEAAESAAILAVHIWASIFIFMRAVFSRWLIAEDLPRLSLITHVAGAVMNVALNLWWIPTHGALGAAYATLISYAFASWITLYLHPRTRPMAHMMARSICLPLRWSALRAYWNEWRGSA